MRLWIKSVESNSSPVRANLKNTVVALRAQSFEQVLEFRERERQRRVSRARERGQRVPRARIRRQLQWVLVRVADRVDAPVALRLPVDEAQVSPTRTRAQCPPK